MAPTPIGKFPSLSVFVVGDIMLDRYIGGEVERISPEAPVPVLKASGEVYTPGGAANVAANLGALGARVRIFGAVGADREGDRVRELLLKRGIETEGIISAKKNPTSIKTRLLAGNQQIARVDREETKPLGREEQRGLLALIGGALDEDPPHGLIISDYSKGVVGRGFCRKLITLAKDRGVFVAADPKGRDFAKYRGSDAITPNQKEAEELCGFRIEDDRTLRRAFRLIFEKRIAPVVLITRGKLGISYSEDGASVATISPEAKEVFDVTGAGDTVVGALVLGYLSTESWEQAIDIANTAAGIAVSRVGTATPTAAELEDALEARSGADSRKIVPRERVSKIASKERGAGRSIVFTNGCFDLLHVGHLRLLKEAKELGEVLIVGLNSDESVGRIKGEGRPLITEGDRTRLIAALECVDYVTVFEEDTPLELIGQIKPDIIVKGGDYTPDQVVEREFVEQYGGRVEIVPLVEGISTTALIERIKNTNG